MISTSGHLISKFPEVRFHRTRICSGGYGDYNGSSVCGSCGVELGIRSGAKEN